MAFVLLRKGTRALNGNGIAFRQPVQNLARALPRYVSETGILLVVRGLVVDEDRQNVSSGSREWKLRRAPVRDALQYLITHSPPYMDPGNGVVIDEGRLTGIPEDGSVFDSVIRQQQRASFQQWRTSNSFQKCADCNLLLSECSCHIRHLQDDSFYQSLQNRSSLRSPIVANWLFLLRRSTVPCPPLVLCVLELLAR